MQRSLPRSRALVVAGLAFAAYPVLRPYGPETGPEGARDLASSAWLAAHLLGMVGFTALATALRADPDPSARRTETWAWAAVVLLLPYYGAEAYGLRSVASYAIEHADPDVLSIADSFRYDAVPMTLFALGFVALAVVGVRIARGTWLAGGAVRAGGLLAGIGLVTYLPQFFAPAGGRMVHGAVLAAGLLLLALSRTSTRAIRDHG